MKEPKISLGVVLLALGIAIGVTAFEYLSEPRGLPWHLLFVVPVVWVALWSAEADTLPVTVMASVTTVLALLPVIVPRAGAPPPPLGERGVVVGIIWITVGLALLRKRTRRTFKWINLISKP